MTTYYALRADGSVEPVNDIMAATWDIDDRRVDKTTVGDYEVSTVFLGVDHSFGGADTLLFETMVFKGDYADLFCDRYSTKAAAQEGHDRVVAALRAGATPDALSGEVAS